MTRITWRDPHDVVLTDFAYSYAHPDTAADTLLRHSVTDHTGATTSYGYDQLDRLVEAVTRDAMGTVVESWGYGWDAAGNRTSISRDGVTVTADYDAANQLTRHGTTAYTHDAAGNLLSADDGSAFTYDTANRTVAMAVRGSDTVEAAYTGASQVDRVDADGVVLASGLLGVASDRAAHRTDNHFTRDDTGTVVGRRLHGTAIRQYYLTGGLGSTVALVDPDGTVDRTYAYTPHGETTRSWGPADSNPWRFAGAYQNNTTGLYHIGHRYLDPTLGRWTQPDPLPQLVNPLTPPDANPYTYAACNPVNHTDPTGLLTDAQRCTLAAVALSAVGIALSVIGAAVGIGGAVFLLQSSCHGRWIQYFYPSHVPLPLDLDGRVL